MRPILDASTLIVCGVVAAALVSCSSADQNDQGGCPDVLVPLVEFNFVDDMTDQPVCNATVRVWMDGAEIMEGDHLTLEECGLLLWSPGDYSVETWADPYDFDVQRISVATDHCGTDAIDIVLHQTVNL